ncbi:uncharacterized protein LOC129575760 [Sitodiplosis mosellana]|uniref:uncharacterized protein LOC129575760 n=1 Tax=Sitodiplosis mosellana TaxID=263140 RepID=UPI002444AA42|nr:uncharacterized protein LOC129575760 [Sitodiplosis mosellana]
MNKVQKIRDDLSQMSPMEREKHKEALAKKLMDKDPSVYLVKPEKSSKSCAWGADCFSLIFNNNVKENYVYCQICSNLITYNSVHGTGSLLRHHCYKKVMNMQKEEHTIVKTLNFTASPKILKSRPRGNENSSPLGDILLNSPELKFQLKGRDNTKQKKEIEELIARGDPSIDMRAPENIKSEVWSNGNFKILYQNGKKLDFVMCLFCHSLITYKSKTGTASLLRHSCIKRLTETIKRERTPTQDDNMHEYVTIPISEEHADDVDATQTTSGADNLSFDNENDTDQDQEQEQYLSNEFPEELKEEAIKLFHYFSFKDMQPTNLAQKKGFLSFGQYLINVGAEYKRVNIEALLDPKHPTGLEVAEKSTNNLQKMLKPKFEDHKIALSCDYWHDPNRKINFLTLYGHYISDLFEIKKINLRTVSFVEEFSTIDYKQLIASMLENYFTSESDIDAFLSKTTTVVFDEMLDCFKSFSTINCSCLTLNRIVIQLIDECGLREALPSDILVTENWCNIWEYLFDDANIGDENIDTATIDEFKRILDPFAKAVNILSCDQKPTINEVYILRKKIEDHFRNARFANGKIRDVALNLIRENFPMTNLHKIALFLDPRFKSLKFMSHEDKASVLSMVSKMVSSDENEGNIIAFGEESNEKHSVQASTINKSSGASISSGGGGDTADSTKYLIEYMDIVEERDETHDEVEIYLNLKFNDISTNILEFWDTRYDLPRLRQLAREILCIPASGIVAEKIFSGDAVLLTKRRLNMEIANVKEMLHIHENFEMLMNVF